MKKISSNNQFGNNLRETLLSTRHSVKKEHFLIVCAKAKQEAYNRNLSKQENMKFRTFLKLQIEFVGWKVWMMQSFLLLLIYILLENSKDILLARNGRYAGFCLCCLAIITVLTAVPLIARTFKYKMYEIEMSSKISNGKLLMVNFSIVAMGNMVMLCTILCISIWKTSLGQGRIIVYLLFPYLLTVATFLYLLRHASRERFLKRSILIVSTILMIAITFEPFLSGILEKTFLVSFGVIGVVLFFYCAYQIRNLVYQFDYMKILE